MNVDLTVQYMNNLTNTKMFLYEQVYSNQDMMNRLLSIISNSINLFNISYQEDKRLIKLKIKKTNIVKKNDDNLLPFYHNTIVNIFSMFYNLELQTINNIINSDPIYLNNRDIILSNLLEYNCIGNLVNIILLEDNIIYIHI